jgi:hypothetical protein
MRNADPIAIAPAVTSQYRLPAVGRSGWRRRVSGAWTMIEPVGLGVKALDIGAFRRTAHHVAGARPQIRWLAGLPVHADWKQRPHGGRGVEQTRHLPCVIAAMDEYWLRGVLESEPFLRREGNP